MTLLALETSWLLCRRFLPFETEIAHKISAQCSFSNMTRTPRGFYLSQFTGGGPLANPEGFHRERCGRSDPYGGTSPSTYPRDDDSVLGWIFHGVCLCRWFCSSYLTRPTFALHRSDQTPFPTTPPLHPPLHSRASLVSYTYRIYSRRNIDPRPPSVNPTNNGVPLILPDLPRPKNR